MDAQVIAAMARWPNVPAVYGWLSLSQAGQWRLHPEGDALHNPRSAGEPITSPQILVFIDRNYESDGRGQWYFQNGPQRVYVRLDAAPFVASTTLDAASGRLKLRTHTGLDVRSIQSMWLDESGHLYVETDRGPALVAGRDLPAVLDALQTDADTGAASDAAAAFEKCMEDGLTVMLRSRTIQGLTGDPVPLRFCRDDDLENALKFRRRPTAEPAGG